MATGSSSSVRRFDVAALRRLRRLARSSPRQRSNLNIHRLPDDPVQRFFNALQLGTYVRPHRHASGRWETTVLLRGAAGLVIFDELGDIVDTVRLALNDCVGVEVQGGTWHTVVAVEDDTLLFEVKPGPYDPALDKEFAGWAPLEGNRGTQQAVDSWRGLVASAGRVNPRRRSGSSRKTPTGAR